MGVGLAVLTETKLTDNRYTRLASGFKILASKATSHNQGGIALLWKENHPGYEVESAQIAMPNLLTFQSLLATSNFIAWEYTPPLQTRWGWKIFGLLGKPAQRAASPLSWVP
jgi:hypothetical protein